MVGALYLVPTPVGNLSDMSPRAVEVLKSVDLILAEDTRTSGVLMQKFGITTPLRSFHMHNEHQQVGNYADMIEEGQRLAVVTDAGTPGISDPGFLISRECRRRNLDVITLPGPTAFVPALVSSGIPCERFCFEGFLPQKKGLQTRLSEIAHEKRTTIIYESPLRLLKTLKALSEVCGADREASVSREISKIHECTHRGTLNELINFFAENNPRGEIVIILAGEPDQPRSQHKNKYKDSSQS